MLKKISDTKLIKSLKPKKIYVIMRYNIIEEKTMIKRSIMNKNIYNNIYDMMPSIIACC